eukprot:CAMPEP_0180100042 /NCGR_PEP_ID=MMETSP0985-20121206/28660_1 /TAXON_ID=483367 /ORGANISM="non described non described, Strain CCMP 2436" /LENGTH=123 /DNA_ID=CAMNT_0022035697 /DNA_START=14 /DNA_END=384 /DNA_ORIENTATION=-
MRVQPLLSCDGPAAPPAAAAAAAAGVSPPRRILAVEDHDFRWHRQVVWRVAELERIAVRLEKLPGSDSAVAVDVDLRHDLLEETVGQVRVEACQHLFELLDAEPVRVAVGLGVRLRAALVLRE